MSTTPVHLITGLLGSGKTTLLQNLLKQKPSEEKWGIIINDFGPLTIDATLVAGADKIVEVRGGCVCCSAQHGLRQALDALLKAGITRILVEPTGVSHPAEITDLFLHHPALELQAIVAVMTPQQLTPARWEKSALMRDLAMLADLVVLNKIDLATADVIQQAEQLLCQQPRPPQTILRASHADCQLHDLLKPHSPPPLLIWQHKPHQCTSFMPHETDLPGLIDAQRSESDGLITLGYRWGPEAVFSRPALRQVFADTAPHRGKGLIRTGKRWQSLQWADNILSLQETAWQRDSRLLVFFDRADAIEPFETRLKDSILLKLAQ
ncbi:CobW/HypB/UreG, nucleotide-binding domain [Sulfurivirga caldicuralii]|uniref:CobW/HypB/UreG, nucleotide-binding domain n=1 Tax=Sulfurivirga caldicuralii TaxID=364032 RepID=A0A1N6GW45_9GAMM|nr:GTP-binding protein [Sulfurivirga caldicuralii]SIO11773.1 CobW/HypB/UreG, nucleotide-binding domain [Sulfurivirga caldicuralii]